MKFRYMLFSSILLKSTLAPWYLYVNPNLNPSILNSEVRYIHLKNSAPLNEEHKRQKTVIEEAMERIEEEKKGCCNHPLKSCCAVTGLATIGLLTGMIGLIVWGCLECCVCDPNERKLEGKLKDLRYELVKLDEKYARDRRLWYFETISKGLYLIKDDLEVCDDCKFDSIETEMKNSRNLRFNIEFANMNSSSGVIEVYSGEFLDCAIWGEDRKEYTGRIMSSLQQLGPNNQTIVPGSIPDSGRGSENDTLKKVGASVATTVATGIAKKLIGF